MTAQRSIHPDFWLPQRKPVGKVKPKAAYAGSLSFLHLCNSTAREILTRDSMPGFVLNAGGLSAVFNTGIEGYGLEPNTGTKPLAASGSGVTYNLPAKGTILCRFTARFAANDGTRRFLFNFTDNGDSGGNRLEWQHYTDGNSYVGWGGSRVTFAQAGSWAAGDLVTVAVTWDATTTTAYVKGVSKGTASTTWVATGNTASASVVIGGAGDVACANTVIHYLAVFDRVLSPAEVRRAQHEPYFFLEPVKRRARKPTAAGAGTQTLTPSLFTNTNTFYAPTVTRGAVSLTPSLFTNTQTFYSPTVSATYGLTPALFTNTQTFYAATVSPGAVTLTPALFTNSQTFYAATVVNGVSLSPSLFTNTQTFYGPTVTTGAVTLTPDLFANDNTFFGATITGGAVVVSTRPTGGPPGKRIKFNGRFYDSVKDRYRLARDVDGYLSVKQAEQPQPTQKPKRKAIKTDVAVIATPPVALDTREIDELSSVLAELKARDSQLQSYISKLRAINEAMAIEEEEFLMMVA